MGRCIDGLLCAVKTVFRQFLLCEENKEKMQPFLLIWKRYMHWYSRCLKGQWRVAKKEEFNQVNLWFACTMQRLTSSNKVLHWPVDTWKLTHFFATWMLSYLSITDHCAVFLAYGLCENVIALCVNTFQLPRPGLIIGRPVKSVSDQATTSRAHEELIQ